MRRHNCERLTTSACGFLLRLLRLISNHFFNLDEWYSVVVRRGHCDVNLTCQTCPKSAVPPSLCGFCALKQISECWWMWKQWPATSRHAVNNSHAVVDDASPFFTVDLVPQLMLNVFFCPLCCLQTWEQQYVCPPACESVSSWELYMVYLWGGLQHVGAHNPFSVFNTPTLLLEFSAWTLNLWASLRLWELTNNLNSHPPPKSCRPRQAAAEMGRVVLRCDLSCTSQPNPIFTACLYIPAANGLHTEAGSRPKSAGSSVQLGQGGNLVISPLHRRLMNSELR